MSPLTKLLVVLILVIIQNANANREFINGTNYKCQDEGNLIELPNHLRKPCMLCTCKKSLVVCEKLKPCAANYREDRRRRSIRCIEEECCNVVQDVFLNNVDSNSKQVSYRTLDSDTSAGEVISNQIRTSTIRYVHCTNELARNNYQNAPQNDRPIDQPSDSHSGLFEFNLKPFGSRSTINTRSVTAHPAGMDRQPDGLCTLSNSLNPDTSKHRQYITTFDGMRMRLRNRDHCHFVFARDCAGEQFTIHLLYSANNHLYANRSLAGRQAAFDLNRSTPDRSTADRSASDDRFLDSINLTSAFHTLDGKSTSNYTQRYLSTLRQSRISSKEKLNLFVRIGKRKLRLDHNLNVKLDNRLILLPYVHRGLKIVKHQSYVILKSEIGLKIIWSGQEVVASLPRYYQRRTCGLCSNFNGDLTDDLKNRKNQAVSQLRFFQSWTTGKNRQCLVSKKRAKSSDPQPTKPQTNRDEENLIKNNTTCKWTFKRKMKATRFCNSLKINLPLKCQGPEVKNYFEDCLEKMCPCNRKCCNCEVLGSYVAKCAKTLENDTVPQQLNMTVFRDECPSFDFNSTSQPNENLNQSRTARESDPPKSEHVELPKCPEGSLYSPCAPIDKYKVTCSDLLPRSESSDRLPEQMDVCQPGCKCRASTVWSDSRFEKCVPIDLCHSLSSNIRKRTINSLNSVLRPRLTFLN